MIKLYRGDVVHVQAPDGKGGLKSRPLIVYKDSKVGSDFLSVYCTSQNDGNDNDNIFVKRSSAEGISMGLTKDTYIRPLQTKNISREFFLRKVGKCNMLNEIDLIIERRMAS